MEHIFPLIYRHWLSIKDVPYKIEEITTLGTYEPYVPNVVTPPLAWERP